MKIPRRSFLLGAAALTLATQAVSLPPNVNIERFDMSYDVVIVGGGVSGLSAALGLGRACRRVLLCSGGPARNAPAAHSHNFLTRDGTSPQELLRIAREQLLPYKNVEVRDLEVDSISRAEGGTFGAKLADGTEVSARKVVLATGISDQLEVLPGLEQVWGKSAFACPFCHGWEVRDQSWAVVLSDPSHFSAAKIARSWTGNLKVCRLAACELSDEQRKTLQDEGVMFEETPVREMLIRGDRLEGLLLEDGCKVECAAVLIRPPFRQRSSLVTMLALRLDTLGYVEVDKMQETSVPGVFAIGDMTSALHSVARAVGSGNFVAGAVLHALT